jgi:hypothetical protein
MILVRGNRCAMCGKETVISDEYDSNKTDKEQKQQELKTSNMIVEQIDAGRRYLGIFLQKLI